MNDVFKTCFKCKQSLPRTTEYFNRNRRTTDGFHSYCKKCRNAQRAEEYKNSPSLIQRAREKANEWFRNNKERAHKAQKANYENKRDDYIRRAKEWREENQDRKKELDKKHYQSYYPDHKKDYVHRTRNRRAKLQSVGGTHTAADIQEIFENQNGCCYYCGVKLQSFEVDHYYPVSKGGSNSKENLVVACRRCNRSKGDKLPDEFLKD